MNRDPLRDKIIQRLENISDDEVFEACVNDLLRAEWPTLIPVPGGDDAGLDGVWTNNEGTGSLIATTATNVIGNVTRNLKQRLVQGKKGERVLVATSTQLSPLQCRNIEKRVAELGFQLAHHPYTQQAIADRLYHKPMWLKELLGLTAELPALSSNPRSVRPGQLLPLIGRTEDFEWLTSTSGDRMVVGQPGMGKTFLTQELVRQGKALFVVDDDPVRLIEAIREQCPTILIVEDAHMYIRTLEFLVRLRRERDLTFNIVADSWPGDEHHVQGMLSIPEESICRLKPLPRKDIVSLVNQFGITGPQAFLNQIVVQSMGCPGRAALLAHLCLQTADGRSVFEGTELARWAYRTFEGLIGERTMSLLAAFAIGGEVGMAVDSVCSILGFPMGDVFQLLTKMAFGGVIQIRSDGNYCVLPGPLRSAVVRDKFFAKGVSLPLNRFLDAAPSPSAAVTEVVKAYCVGANITSMELLKLVDVVDSDSVWEVFLWSSPENTKLALQRNSALALRFPEACLCHTPDDVIPLFLETANNDMRELHNTPEHLVRKISDWVREPRPETDGISRRQILWKHVSLLMQDELTEKSAFRALPIVVDPGFEFHEQSAIDTNSYTFRFGLLSVSELKRLSLVWDEILTRLPEISGVHWDFVLRGMDEWVYPQSRGPYITEDQKHIFYETACRLILRLAEWGCQYPAIGSALLCRASELGMITSEITIDEEYATLFPADVSRNPEEWEHDSKTNSDKARKLSERWIVADPNLVCRKIGWCIEESSRLQYRRQDYLQMIADILSRQVTNIHVWTLAAIASSKSHILVRLLLQRLRPIDSSAWIDCVRKCIDQAEMAVAAFEELLVAEFIDEDLEQFVIDGLKKWYPVAAYHTRLGNVPSSRIRRFLACDNPTICGAIADALFESGLISREGELAELRDVWMQAVIKSDVKDYQLGRMFESDASLAALWIEDRISRESSGVIYKPRAALSAARCLTEASRLELLERVNPSVSDCLGLVKALVGDDHKLYKTLLRMPELQRFHLQPLHRPPSDIWATLAIVALKEGISAEDIVASALIDSEVTMGSVPAKYERLAEQWMALINHHDQLIRNLAVVGYAQANRVAEEWRLREAKSDLWEQYN